VSSLVITRSDAEDSFGLDLALAYDVSELEL
jgi:hypothetical protein